MNFSRSLAFRAAATPPSGGGGGTPPAFIGATTADGSGASFTVPPGTTASSTLVQFTHGLGTQHSTDAAPTGWTRIGGGIIQTPDASSYGIFSAPGNVSELTLGSFPNGYRRIVSFDGVLRNIEDAGYDYTNSPGANPPAPSVAGEDGDMIISGYFQVEKAGTFTLTVEPGYSVAYDDDELYGQGQVLLREDVEEGTGLTSGLTGTIRHGMTDGYNAFFVASLSVGPTP